MGRELTIEWITATQGYNVFICDNDLITCVYLSTINDSDLPYSVVIPSPYDTMTNYKIKIVDSNGCEIIKSF